MNRKYESKEQLILLMQAWVKKHGEVPNKKQIEEDKAMPSTNTYKVYFGTTWTNALIECGFKPKKMSSEVMNANLVKARAARVSYGNKGGRWIGGRINFNGYIKIWMPDDPRSTKEGYILEHRLIMSEAIGRPLEDFEDVHHINKVKNDNRIENLLLLTRSEHTILHEKNKDHNQSLKKINKCIYPGCDTLIKNKHGLCNKHYREQWARIKKGLIVSYEDFKKIIPRRSPENKAALIERCKNMPRENGKFVKKYKEE